MFEVITSNFSNSNTLAEEFEDYNSANSFKQYLLDIGDITDERQIWIIWFN